MAKFNVTDKRTSRSPGPVGTSPVANTVTGNKGAGYAYEAKSELFLLAVSSFFNQKKFYETAKSADARFTNLVKQITQADPAWMLGFITWLRGPGNMRTSAVVASVEAALVAKADLQPGSDLGMARQLAQAGIGRADEIGEAVAYFQSVHKSKRLPKPVKRGLADAYVKLVNEYSAVKWGGGDKAAWTLGQLANILHPKAGSPWQADLFGYLVAKEYGDVEVPETLTRIRLRNSLLAWVPDMRRDFIRTNTAAAQVLKDAGMTWEALAGWLQGPMDAKAWEAIIPSMGYMALLRNLRNFDEAKISNASAAYVMAKLANEAEVKRSKQFPFRFLAAHRAAPHGRWHAPLSMALDACLANIPVLPGRTLVMVDTSGSMDMAFSDHSEMRNWDAAAMFGIALGKAAEGVDGAHVDIVSYSTREAQFKLTKGADLLSEMTRWQASYNQRGGTDTWGSTSRMYRGHDRVIILTDEQANYHPLADRVVPADKHVFTFNLAGHRAGHAPTGKFRHSFGGLTDACFPLIASIEQAHAGTWPWEMEQR